MGLQENGVFRPEVQISEAEQAFVKKLADVYRAAGYDGEKVELWGVLVTKGYTLSISPLITAAEKPQLVCLQQNRGEKPISVKPAWLIPHNGNGTMPLGVTVRTEPDCTEGIFTGNARLCTVVSEQGKPCLALRGAPSGVRQVPFLSPQPLSVNEVSSWLIKTIEPSEEADFRKQLSRSGEIYHVLCRSLPQTDIQPKANS